MTSNISETSPRTVSRPKRLQVSYTFQVIPPGQPWRRRWPPWSLEVEEKHHQDLPWVAAATYHGLHPLEVVWQCHGRTWNNDWSDGVARARFLNQCGGLRLRFPSQSSFSLKTGSPGCIYGTSDPGRCSVGGGALRQRLSSAGILITWVHRKPL